MVTLALTTCGFMLFLLGVVFGIFLDRITPKRNASTLELEEERRDNVVPFAPIPRRPTF